MLKKEVVVSQKDRITNLEKQMKGLQMRITHEINPPLTDLRKQVKTLEKGMTTLQNNQSDKMKHCIERQKRFNGEKPDGAVTNVTDRLTALEDATDALAKVMREIVEGDADWGVRMEEAEDSIHVLQMEISSQKIEAR